MGYRIRDHIRRVAAATAAVAALVAGALPGAGSAVLQAEAAAPGTAAYTQALNKAIMYTVDVYQDNPAGEDEDAPMDLSTWIACLYGDARPVSYGKTYLSGGNQVGESAVNYSLDGAGNITSRTVKTSGWADENDGTWNYSWDGSGWLTGVNWNYSSGWYHEEKAAGAEVHLGADGRPVSMDAPTLSNYSSYPQNYSYTYDAAGRITAVNVTRVDPSAGTQTVYANTYAYNTNGTLRKVTRGDGAGFFIFHYDGTGRLAMSYHERTNGGVDDATQYNYDAAGKPVNCTGYRNSQVWYQESFNY